jgi:hypothetical protein
VHGQGPAVAEGHLGDLGQPQDQAGQGRPARAPAGPPDQDGQDQLDQGQGDDQLGVALVQPQAGGVAAQVAAGERRLGKDQGGVGQAMARRARAAWPRLMTR